MSDKERYYSNASNLTKILTEYLENTYWTKNYDTQIIPLANNKIALQIKKEGLRYLVGMSQCLSIVFEEVGNDLKIQLGQASWADKVISGAVWALVLWPVAITAGIGAYTQYQLIDEIWMNIDSSIRYNLNQHFIPYTTYNYQFQNCNINNDSNINNSSYQNPINNESKKCIKCGRQLMPDALFCTYCGTKN